MSGAQGAVVCALCRRQLVDPRWRPFCSQRCQLHDLGRWVDGTYTIVGERAGDDATDETFDVNPNKD